MCARLINIVTRLKTAWDSLAQGREHKEPISSLNEPWTAVLQLQCYQKHTASHLPRVPSIHHPSMPFYHISISQFTHLLVFSISDAFADKYICDLHCAFKKQCCHYPCMHTYITYKVTSKYSVYLTRAKFRKKYYSACIIYD